MNTVKKRMLYSMIFYLMIYSIVYTQKFKFRISMSGKTSMKIVLKNIPVPLLFKFSKQCIENIFCRTFVSNDTISYCQLYQSNLALGNIISSTSRIGSILYQQSDYINYNKTCKLLSI